MADRSPPPALVVARAAMPPSPHILYLTGSTGYIGGVVLDQCETDNSIAKVYCPIRAKKGFSGQERFAILMGQECLTKKAVFVETTAPIPHDITHVILNAYDLKFFTPVSQILKENVEPMLRLLHQCRSHPKIMGITVVSTAFVQLPLPFMRDPNNRVPFIGKEHGISASDLLDNLVQECKASVHTCTLLDNHQLPEWFQFNQYAYSKHIMEHVVAERFGDLPICIVRPSVVAHSRDGTYGHGIKNGFPGFLAVARQSVVRFPRNEGRIDIVFVEDVAKDLVIGATKYAHPVEDGHDHHPILMSSSGFPKSDSSLTNLELFQIMAPTVRRWGIRNPLLRSFLRSLERLGVQVVAGKRKAKLVRLIYKNFDPTMCQTWDFEMRHELNVEEFRSSVNNYYKLDNKLDQQKKEKPLSRDETNNK